MSQEHLNRKVKKARHKPRWAAPLRLNIAGKSAFILWIVLSCVLPSTDAFGGDTSVPPFSPMIGYSERVFVDVDLEDAKTVTKIWSNLIAQKRGGKAETIIYSNHNYLEKDLRGKKVDLIAMVSNEFLEFNPKELLQPVMVSARSKTYCEELLLIARKDSGIKNINDLRQKQFIIHKGQYAIVHLTWLELLLMREGFSDIWTFFSTVKEAKKPSQALLPVFFRQADACILTLHSFQVIAELNPQLQAELTVLARSPPFLGGLIAFRKDYNEHNKEILMDIMVNLHKDPQGKQLLMLFRMEHLVPFKPEYLNTMEALLKEHRDLKVRIARVKQ